MSGAAQMVRDEEFIEGVMTPALPGVVLRSSC